MQSHQNHALCDAKKKTNSNGAAMAQDKVTAQFVLYFVKTFEPERSPTIAVSQVLITFIGLPI